MALSVQIEKAPGAAADGVRVLIVEDRLLLAESLGLAFATAGIASELVTEPTVAAVQAAVEAWHPTVAIVALGLGNGSRTEPIVGTLCESGLPTLVMTGGPDRVRLASCVEEGAVGIIDKSMDIDTVIRVTRHASDTHAALSRDDRYRLEDELRAYRSRMRESRRPLARLTPREIEVLRNLTDGYRAKEIAQRLDVSLCTVRSHIKSILAELGVSSQLQAIAQATRGRWFDDRSSDTAVTRLDIPEDHQI